MEAIFGRKKTRKERVFGSKIILLLLRRKKGKKEDESCRKKDKYATANDLELKGSHV